MYNISINLLIAHSKESAGKYISVVEYCSDKAKVAKIINLLSKFIILASFKILKSMILIF